jgi:hypothetical protein
MDRSVTGTFQLKWFRARLLSATAIQRMAIVSYATEVPDPRIAGVALAVHSDKALAAMIQTLELDDGMRVLRQQEGGRAHKSDDPPFHAFPHAWIGLLVPSDRAAFLCVLSSRVQRKFLRPRPTPHDNEDLQLF